MWKFVLTLNTLIFFPHCISSIFCPPGERNCNNGYPCFRDRIPPMILCNALKFTVPQFSQSVLVTFSAPYATDNCGTPRVQQTGGISSGRYYSAGRYTAYFIATDASGNQDSCAMIIVVEDIIILPIRLRDGITRDEGRLEVFYNGVWGTVCDDVFGLSDAKVACRQMGYVDGIPLYFYASGTGQIWLDEVACQGWETSIFNCQHNVFGVHDCSHNEDVGVRCSNSILSTVSPTTRLETTRTSTGVTTPPAMLSTTRLETTRTSTGVTTPPASGPTIRLRDGRNQYEGRVEVYYNFVWGTVCDDFFDALAAAVVCRQLGYTGGIPIYSSNYGTGRIWLDNVQCRGNEMSLFDCQHNAFGYNDCSHSEDVSVRCTAITPIRLRDGSNQNEGRLEVFYNGVWGTVCDDSFDLFDARVACRQLGYTDGIPLYSYASGTGQIWLDEVMCQGFETYLSTCQHNGFGFHDCSHLEDVGVRCLGNNTYTTVSPTTVRATTRTSTSVTTSVTGIPCQNISAASLPTGMYVQSYSGSLALLACKNQLVLIGQPYKQCLSTGLWSNTSAVCQDLTPPQFLDCPASISRYSDRGSNKAFITWGAPTVSDNFDVIVHINLTGPGPSYFFESPVPYVIQYDAIDAAGNKALPCRFTITVSPLLCTDEIPLSAHEWVNCSRGYRWGASCTLGCFEQYPLIGRNSVSCEATAADPPIAYWDWQGQNTSYCRELECPALNIPSNGAVACSKWTNGPICQLQCHNGYEIAEYYALPLSESIMIYTCSTLTGKWYQELPLPDCTEINYSSLTSVLNQLSYFTGNCSSTKTLNKIASNFIKALNASNFNSVCVDVPACSINNVIVTCSSATSKRRKRDTQAIIVITFNQNIALPQQRDRVNLDDLKRNVSTTFAALKNSTLKLINSGNLDTLGMSDLKLVRTSFVTEKQQLSCPPGMVPRTNTYTCAPCMKGSFFNITTGKCQACSTGTYQDEFGQLACKQCPPLHSTLLSVRSNITECIAMCQPGTYSSSGLEPCTLCPVGSYQSLYGQMSCLKCPTNAGFNQTTSAAGATRCPGTNQKCPALKTPLNGALACAAGSSWRLCQLQCNSNYDVPEKNSLLALSFGDGVYMCSADVWNPYSLVPDCSVRHNKGDIYELNSLSYYDGNCSLASTQQQISSNLLKVLTVSSLLNTNCINSGTCLVDSFSVTCG